MSPTDIPLTLSKLTIDNFRGIDHLELNFSEPEPDNASVCVLAGANGFGKTSVLEAILLLLGRNDLLPADTARLEDLIRQGARDFTITGQFRSGDQTHEVVAHAVDLVEVQKWLVAAGHPRYGVSIQPKELADYLGTRRLGALKPTNYSVESFSARREPEELGTETSSLRGPQSRREERRLVELKRRLVNISMRSNREAVFAKLNAFIQPFFGTKWTLDVLFRDDSNGSEALVVVRDGLLPTGVHGELRTLDAIRAHAMAGGPAPRTIPIDRLSSGQMALLAFAYPFVVGDQEVNLALIDEPEQHLHPLWQRAFIPALRRLSPRTQFIVATHSAQVLDSVASYERVELLSSDHDLRGPITAAAE